MRCTCDRLSVDALRLNKPRTPEPCMVWRMLGIHNAEEEEDLLTQSKAKIPGIKNQKRLFKKVKNQLEHSASINDDLLLCSADNLNEFTRSAKSLRNSFRNNLSKKTLQQTSSSQRPSTAPPSFVQPSSRLATSHDFIGDQQTSESTKSRASELQVMQSHSSKTRLQSILISGRLELLRDTKKFNKRRAQQRQLFREKVAVKLIQRGE